MTTRDGQDGGRLRVLHAEDEPRDAELVQAALEGEGLECTVHRVQTREDFLAALDEQTFDIVLADYTMPSFDGMSALRLVRGRGLELPFILISGTLGEELAIQALKAGATDYVLKDRLERIGPAVSRALQEAASRRRRQQAEEALRRGERKYRELFEQSIDPIYAVGRDGRILEVNQAMVDLFGYDRNELVGMSAAALHTAPRDRETFRRILESRGAIRDFEHELRHKDGTRLDCVESARVRRDDDGGMAGYQGVIRDVTRHRQLESQLRQAQKMEAVGQLAGGVAHDFNNLLTGICGYTRLVLGQLDADDPRRDDLKRVIDLGEQAANLTRRLLAFGRRQPMQPVLFPVDAMVRNASSMFGRLIGEDVEVVLELAADTGQLHADPMEIEQVLLNLVINARDAMPRGGTVTIATGGVDIDAATAGDLKPGPYVRISVSDTGEGIEPDHRDRIFEPFFTTKEPGKGTGLGLATVYSAVRQHGGEVRVESEPGQGATFELLLPRASENASASPGADVAGVAGQIEAGAGVILVVEDEQYVRDVARRILEEAGYRVLVAGDPDKAMAIFEESAGDVDLLLTDVIMPGIDGPTLYETLARERPGLRVVFMSGYAERAFSRTDIDDTWYIQKPFSPSELTSTIRRALEER